MNWSHQLLAILVLVAAIPIPRGAVHAEPPGDWEGAKGIRPYRVRNTEIAPAEFSERIGISTDSSCDQGHCGTALYSTSKEADSAPEFFFGADYLLVRPHFSEAIAFAHASLGATNIDVVGRDLAFGYESSLRAFVGYRLEGNEAEFRFTYWHLPGETHANGVNPGAGQFLIDPFGNVVGIGVVIDPNSALFGNPIFGGESISTTASVETNLYDLDLAKIWVSQDRGWSVQTSVGVRIVDIDQFYESEILDAGGAFFSGGDFAVDFIGAGPRVGIEGRRHFGEDRRVSLFANAHGALILGDYDVRFSQTTNMPPFPPFDASQTTSSTRTIPVTEAELGATCRIGNQFHLSVGWIFQAWYDLGASGGKFAGFFSGADDANIMSFDGLFIRGEFAF